MPAMIGARRFMGGQNYCAEARALFAAMNTPPPVTRKRLIDATIRLLKSSTVWADEDIIYVTAAHDSQAGRLNWKNPGTFTLLTVNSPTFVVDRGYTGDGSSSRLRTQYTPSVNGVNLTQNSASMWVWSLTEGQAASREAGNSSTAPACDIIVRTAGNQSNVRACDGTASASSGATVTSALGLFGTQRISSSVKRAWRNGVQTGSDISVASTGLPTQEQWICGGNSTVFSSRQIGFAAWGASLVGKESALNSAMLPYMQSVGAA